MAVHFVGVNFMVHVSFFLGTVNKVPERLPCLPSSSSVSVSILQNKSEKKSAISQLRAAGPQAAVKTGATKHDQEISLIYHV
jgi:hypothetical protein